MPGKPASRQGDAVAHGLVVQASATSQIRYPFDAANRLTGSQRGARAHRYGFDFLTDHAGTPLTLVDTEGKVLWQAENDDWGAVRDEKGGAHSIDPLVRQPIRFQEQWEDEETGFYYNRHRHYDPKQGRYITQDPIGLDGGLNPYAYPLNPVEQSDPKGLLALPAALLPGAAFIWVIMAAAITRKNNGIGKCCSSSEDDLDNPFKLPARNTLPIPPPIDPCDKKLENSFLKELKIDAHKIKDEMLSDGNWGAYNLCGCRDGRILLKRSPDCRGSGGKETGEFWK
jgi:RHS repeat-associated protein